MLLFQAPIVPATCAAAVSKTESVGVPWCTLLVQTVGVFKMHNSIGKATCTGYDSASDTFDSGFCAGGNSSPPI